MKERFQQKLEIRQKRALIFLASMILILGVLSGPAGSTSELTSNEPTLIATPTLTSTPTPISP